MKLTFSILFFVLFYLFSWHNRIATKTKPVFMVYTLLYAYDVELEYNNEVENFDFEEEFINFMENKK